MKESTTGRTAKKEGERERERRDGTDRTLTAKW